MNGDGGDPGTAASSDEAPTQYIPRIVEPVSSASPAMPVSPASPAEAQTEMIPKVVYSPPPPSQYPDQGGYGGPGDPYDPYGAAGPGDPSGPEQGSRSARNTERATRSAQRKLLILSGIGEVLLTLGAVMALYVVYTLWWTNVEAHKAATAEANQIQQQFQQQLAPSTPGGASAPPKSNFAPSEGFALMSIPAIGKLNIPVMQGVDKTKVLDQGAVGHYTTPATAMPWDPTGNFAVAAHRRTHGEPFRYINQLRVGDHVVVETTHGWYIYGLDKELPQTDPTNIGTIAPVPVGGPFTKPGQYITLTTCTPEWASTYRLIWWGHLERVDPLTGPPPPELKDANRHT